jgi:hypothetical protein
MTVLIPAVGATALLECCPRGGDALAASIPGLLVEMPDGAFSVEESELVLHDAHLDDGV